MAEIGFVPLAAGGAVKFGTYTGDGAANRTINLGITPKWMLIVDRNGKCIALMSPGYPLEYDFDKHCEIVGSTIKTYHGTSDNLNPANEQNVLYYFLCGI